MSPTPRYHVVDDLKFSPGFQESHIRSCLDYNAQAEDIFVVTYPKCGTTWAQQIMILLMNGGQVPADFAERDLFTFSPFLEMQGANGIGTMARPFAIKTHLCRSGQPWHDKAKYVIVLRNPKDACVSFYYHHLAWSGYAFDGTFHEFFPPWLAGEVECGSYFDWVLSWWPLRSRKNIHMTTYEAMKEDPSGEITKMSQFLELNLTEETIASVVEMSSFEAMSAVGGRPKTSNLRKGIVGDWRSHFNDEENEAMKKTFDEKFAGTELLTLWDKYNVFP